MDPRNQEFIALAKLSGWSQAEIARQLHLTPGAVSQIFHGKTRPRPRTLHLFKMVLTKRDAIVFRHFEKTLGLDTWELEVLEWMRRLHEPHRRRFFEALKLLIKTFSSAGKQQRA